MMDYLVSFASLLGLFIIGIQCEECLRVPTISIECFDDDQPSKTVSIQCPEAHRISIKEAYYWIAKDPSCPTSPLESGASTRIKQLDTIIKGCSDVSCTQDITKVESDRAESVYNVGGRHYLQIEYRCIPDQDHQYVSQFISICDAKTISGNMVTIRSYTDPDKRTYFNSTNCACRIYMEANTEVEFRRLQFEVSPVSFSAVCDPRVVLWKIEGDQNSICHPSAAATSRVNPTFGCYEKDDHINLSFDNKDESYSAAFTIEVSAPKSKTLQVQCGMDASTMNWTSTTVTMRRLPTTTRLPSTTRTTPPPAASRSGPSKNTQIIIGVAVALIAIIVIVVIIIFIRLRKSKEVDEYDKNFNPSNSFYATISKGANGEGMVNVGSQKAYPRIHAMPQSFESPASMPVDEDADVAL